MPKQFIDTGLAESLTSGYEVFLCQEDISSRSMPEDDWAGAELIAEDNHFLVRKCIKKRHPV